MGMATLLRTLVALAFLLAAAAFMFGVMPGYELRSGDTYPAISRPQWLLGFFVLLLAPGIAIWRKPTIGYALCWSLWGMALTVTTLVATYGVDQWRHVAAVLWPARAFAIAVLALVGLVIGLVPIATGVCWWLTRDKVVPPTLPRARVVKTLA